MEKESTLSEKLSLRAKAFNAISDFVKLTIIFVVIFIVSRLYEIAIIGFAHNFVGSNIGLQLLGILFDIIFAFQILLPVFVIFLLLYLISKKLALIGYFLMSLFLVIANLLFISYFKFALVPLGNDLFGYSTDEMSTTIHASGGSNFTTYFILAIIVLLFIFLSVIIIRKIFKRTLTFVIISLVGVFGLFGFLFNPQASSFSNLFNYYLTVNKSQYFYTNIYNHKRNDVKAVNDVNSIKMAEVQKDFEYVSKDYPLLHKENTPDVLSEFFNKADTPPNLVFIIVESLGRAYSGPNAYLGSFTPYLDSLGEHSLYWQNFLSAGGRTFAVLPSVFGSLPFSDQGFLELGTKMPDHQTMLKILKNNGYQTRFTFGGEVHFDLMDIFLERQHIDKIWEDDNFGPGYSKLPKNDKNYTWGFGDKDIFRKNLEVMKNDGSKPRLDIIITTAMHDPFRVPNQDYYNKRFEQRMTDLNFMDNQKEDHRSFHNNYETMLYFDDALRYYISEYSKRADFKNTIFIITGDHRMPEIPLSTQIDRFRVPLIIYSPLLKKAQKFYSISTHFDITPSFLAYLNKSYGIKIPYYVAWLGKGLDISDGFNKNRSYPLMRNKNELVDYLDGAYFLSNNELYIINENLDIEKTENGPQLQSSIQKFQNFLNVNSYVCKNNRIIPDSLK